MESRVEGVRCVKRGYQRVYGAARESLGCRVYHGARPVHLIITMIKWIRTRRLSIKGVLCEDVGALLDVDGGVELDLLHLEAVAQFDDPPEEFDDLLSCLMFDIWGGNNSNGFQDFHTENGSRQGQNLALTGLCVPSWLDSGQLRHCFVRLGPRP